MTRLHVDSAYVPSVWLRGRRGWSRRRLRDIVRVIAGSLLYFGCLAELLFAILILAAARGAL